MSGSSDPGTRVRLDLAYDGTAFNGWARQPGLRTVQGVVEDALATLFTRTPPSPTLVVAGRTDAGVHAADQVVHLDLTADQLDALRRVRVGAEPAPEAGAALAHRLNGVLGQSSDVVIKRGAIAPAGFDARFSAVWRRYEYRVSDRVETRDPAQRHRTVWWPDALDLPAMQAGAEQLLGLHDFAAYCKPRAGATTIRTLQGYRWRRDDAGVLIAELQADAFCHSMVRALVGAAVAVGEGRLEASDLGLILDVGERTSAFKVMAAKGLTLTEVGYPAAGELAARAAATRARREL
ncbi:tRNA pseudouridine(38-40) synthase TruA [Gryllotalpicola reticulitermitis]|uniref:tRNA pseudouridine synthase A n=1 Tax=Gryllotalpicola reticulitermitis TaxID=1184153 RepID=A0ABV8Q1R0_9MICO